MNPSLKTYFLTDAGLLREILRTWSPRGDHCMMLYEQEYTIRYKGDGCDIPFRVLRLLCDIYGLTGAQLQQLRRHTNVSD